MASNGNLNSALETYEGFLSLLKWGTAISIAAAALVIVLIA